MRKIKLKCILGEKEDENGEKDIVRNIEATEYSQRSRNVNLVHGKEVEKTKGGR